MKKKILLFILLTLSVSARMYEDGTAPQHWNVYTRNQGVISSEQGMIKLEGNGVLTGYVLPLRIPYQENSIFSWRLQYNEYFKVYVQVNTLDGLRYLSYFPINWEIGKSGIFIKYALGQIANGQRHTFRRNLHQDLIKYEPNNRITDVLGFFIRGSGLVDNIQLIDDAPQPQTASFTPIQNLMKEAMNGTNNSVRYIVAGDSTRDNAFNRMIRYYRWQLSKLNIEVYDNARASLSGKEWKDDVRATNITKALENTEGEGENTIFEYSFGINDVVENITKAEIKSDLKEGIERYMRLRPQAKVFLVVPVATSQNWRNRLLKEIYVELADELHLPLVDALIPTVDLVGNSRFYEDRTHPNARGSRIIANYIFKEVGDDIIDRALGL